jgi:hypothetical protein
LANTLTYYNTAKITAVGSFIVQAPVYLLRAKLTKIKPAKLLPMRFANSDENFADDPEGVEVQVYQDPLELFKLL